MMTDVVCRIRQMSEENKTRFCITTIKSIPDNLKELSAPDIHLTPAAQATGHSGHSKSLHYFDDCSNPIPSSSHRQRHQHRRFQQATVAGSTIKKTLGIGNPNPLLTVT